LVITSRALGAVVLGSGSLNGTVFAFGTLNTFVVCFQKTNRITPPTTVAIGTTGVLWSIEHQQIKTNFEFSLGTRLTLRASGIELVALAFEVAGDGILTTTALVAASERWRTTIVF